MALKPRLRCSVLSSFLSSFMIFCIVGVVAQTQTELDGGEDESSCYCNSGEDCNNGTCPRNFGCEVRLEYQGSSIIQYQFCVQIFIISTCEVRDSDVLCCDENMCNKCPNLYKFGRVITEEEYYNLTRQLPTECNYEPFSTTMEAQNVIVTDSPALPQRPLWLVPIVVLAIIFIFMMLVMVIVLCYVINKRCKSVDVESIGAPPSYDYSGTGFSQSSKSGARGPNTKLLQIKTLSGLIKLDKHIAKGGFGEVFKGNWDGEAYAVKIFPARLSEFWEREGNIYKTSLLSHKNILNFVSMDTKETSCKIDYWLIFDYHDNGTLAKYISNNTLSRSRCLNFLIGIATGLGYLHRAIYTSTKDMKPVIAHRDIKPNNILIKKDMSCCIGDLGLAVTESDFSKGGKLPNPKQGTKRYLAPEILGGTIITKNIHSYVMADIYAFSLIIWEVTRRNAWHGEIVAHEVPYNNVVPSDPTLEEMRLKVVEEKYRPPVDTTWKNDEILSVLSRTVHECWREDPQGRLNAVRIMKNLQAVNVEAKLSYTSNED